MSIRPTEDGGRVAYGDTPWGVYRVEFTCDYDGPAFDASGREVGRVLMKAKTPQAESTNSVSSVGDRFAAAMHDRLGGVPCGACDTERKRLNTLTPEQAQAQREQIIEATIERAKNLPRWRDRIRAKLGDTIAPEHLRRVIGECLDEAINHTE